MNKNEFKILIKGMKAVYLQETFIPDKEAFDVWYGFLSDIPYGTLSRAVSEYIRHETFPPTIADLRNYVDTITGSSWSVAWNKFKSGCPMNEVDYPGQYAYSTIGAYAMDNRNDLRTMQEFRKLYREFGLMDNEVKADMFRKGLLVWNKDDEKKKLGVDSDKTLLG